LNFQGKSVLLIVSGGIAAYKALELIRLLTKAGCGVKTVLTKSGAQFVTPLSLQALSGQKVYTDLFSLTDESEMGHIELSRAADLVVVAPPPPTSSPKWPPASPTTSPQLCSWPPTNASSPPPP